jgi:hypothetical protein
MRFLPASLLLLAAATSTAGAQGPMRAAPSTRAISEVSLTFADTTAARAAGKPSTIRIDYGQPHLRGRRLHEGNLVPMDSAWRLGANESTMLISDVDLTIGGQAVPKGRYILFAIPRRAGWTLTLQRYDGAEARPMAMRYDQTKDAARVSLRATALPAPQESLVITLIPSAEAGPARGELRIMWGTVSLTTDWATR